MVLVAGGDGGSNTALDTLELFDPYAYPGMNWSLLGGSTTPITMQNARMRHTMTRLLDGSVLIAGGGTTNLDTDLTFTADLFTPSITDSTTGTLTAVGRLEGGAGTPLGSASAVLTGSGTVVVAGGMKGITAPAVTKDLQIYDPAAKTFTVQSSALPTAAQAIMAVEGADGRVQLLGGLNAAGTYVSPFATYDPITPSIVTGSTLLAPGADGKNARAVLLVTGKILVAGYDEASGTIPAEILSFTP
jgi:hypothetical protein